MLSRPGEEQWSRQLCFLSPWDPVWGGRYVKLIIWDNLNIIHVPKTLLREDGGGKLRWKLPWASPSSTSELILIDWLLYPLNCAERFTHIDLFKPYHKLKSRYLYFNFLQRLECLSLDCKVRSWQSGALAPRGTGEVIYSALLLVHLGPLSKILIEWGLPILKKTSGNQWPGGENVKIRKRSLWITTDRKQSNQLRYKGVSLVLWFPGKGQ